jgi:ATP-dependent Zn protease
MDLLQIAHHEAGHAVAHLELGLRQGRVTIQPDPSRDSLGHTELRHPRWMLKEPMSRYEEQRRRLHAEHVIIAALAGRIAEQKYVGRRITWGHERDYHAARDLASTVISYHDKVLQTFLNYCEEQSKALVGARWPEIQAVAHVLVERKSLKAHEIREVIASVYDVSR